MVVARRDFLASGIYQPIAERLAKYVTMVSQGEAITLADAGCGEGYYLRQIKQLCYPTAKTTLDTAFIGWDISKFATQSAAKQSDFGTWLTASNAAIPLSANAIDALLNVFGFEVADEFARVLKRGGFLITADAGEKHLIDIRELIYPDIKPYRPKNLLDNKHFSLCKQESLRYETTINAQQLAQLLLMTPHFFRATAERKANLQAHAQLTVTIDVIFRIYQRI